MLLDCGVGEDSWESLGLLEIQPVYPKGNQSWIFIGRTDVEAETPILWPPDAKSWFIGKYPDAGKDWGQEEKGTTEDKMVGWHHQLNGHGFVWTLGVGDGQGGLACCGSWSRKESDMTEQLNWIELNWEIAEDRIAWHAALHGIAMSWTHLSDWTTTTTKYVGVPNITLRFSIFYIYFFILSIYPFFFFHCLNICYNNVGIISFRTCQYCWSLHSLLF